jgi:SPP1 gp7 family putative phage head morphogenesis protein
MGEDKDIFVMFDTSGVKALQGDFKTQAETATSWWRMGVPANTLIAIFGPPNMESFEGGDESYPGGGATPLDPATQDQVPLDPEGTPEDAPPEDEEDSRAATKAAVDQNKALDDAAWKKFISTQEPFTRKLRQEIKRLFAGQKRKVLAKVRKHYKAAPAAGQKASFEAFVLNVHEEADSWAKKLKPIIRSIFEKYGAQAVQDFSTGIDFSINNPRAVAFLDQHTPKFTFEVNSTSMERIKLLIGEKINLGATQAELTSAIRDEFSFYEKYRAARIARTESGIAGNAGINEGFHQAGVKTKRWLASRDEKVRDTHNIADGQEVAVSDPFDVGGFLLNHPGDPSGPAGEIINCRCTMRGLTEDSE